MRRVLFLGAAVCCLLAGEISAADPSVRLDIKLKIGTEERSENTTVKPGDTATIREAIAGEKATWIFAITPTTVALPDRDGEGVLLALQVSKEVDGSSTVVSSPKVMTLYDVPASVSMSGDDKVPLSLSITPKKNEKE